MTDRELMQMALDALEDIADDAEESHKTVAAIEAIRARLEQPEPKPVAWMYQQEDTGVTMCAVVQQVGSGFEKNNPRWQKIAPLYTAPPQREWQGLTDEEYEAMAEHYVTNCYFDTLKYARAIEAKLKEKNG